MELLCCDLSLKIRSVEDVEVEVKYYFKGVQDGELFSFEGSQLHTIALESVLVGDDIVRIECAVQDNQVTIQHVAHPRKNRGQGFFVSGKCIVAWFNQGIDFRDITFEPVKWRQSRIRRTRIKIVAEPTAYPIMLANGQLLETETWSDQPFHSRTYLDVSEKFFNQTSLIAGPIITDLCPHVTVR
eukprot:Protomagalhaensia_wolfi_Nauph_80__3631@NODE_3668_length_739_cov_111_534286_g2889_i0_p2_GENE_NODE_3668_length_739_cov_111_534286_g2889_i0NODE_3668_length_739_cov_111_534286_g2889_i0_p2_ORF_typecomplete_len185_score24_24_NODE_3668_length_739_cov_111_534286_g2889_i0125679